MGRKRKAKPVVQANAEEFLPKPLLQKVLVAIADEDFSRRVTFRKKGALSRTETLLGDDLASECRKHLKAYLPIRLYFGTPKNKKQQGRPGLPFRSRAEHMVKKEHFRVEVVAAYFGTRRQTLTNWGLRQPWRSKQRRVPDARFAEMFQLGLEHLADVFECYTSTAAIMEKIHVTRESTARNVIAQVGLLVDTVGRS